MKMNKLIIAGGTGFLGDALVHHYSDVKEIVVLTRGATRQMNNVRYVKWDGVTLGGWEKELENADALINLTGKSVDCRYTEANKAEIVSSRVNATRILVKAVNNCQCPPKVWLNAASATIYRAAEDRAMDEYTGEMGSGFSVEVCKSWEAAFTREETPRTRKVILRISMILGKGGGVIPVLSKLTKLGLGGTMGSGKQYISWMHEHDFVKAVDWLIQNEKAEGAYNMAAPDPLPNKEFMKRMRSLLHRSIGLPATAWMLEIGALFLRTETELVLKSRRVMPARLLKEGFVFDYPTTEGALRNLLQ